MNANLSKIWKSTK